MAALLSSRSRCLDRRRRPLTHVSLLACVVAYAFTFLAEITFVGHWAAYAPRDCSIVGRRGDMIQVPGQMKNGLRILLDDVPYQIMSFLSKKQGKGVGIVKTKVKNLFTGATVDKSFNSGTKLTTIDTIWKDASFSYYDDSNDQYVFMDSETFEEIAIPATVLGDSAQYLGESDVSLEAYEGKFIQMRIKGDIIFTIDKVNDSGRSDGDKTVILSNGMTKQGPGYLKEGDRVILHPDTYEIQKRV